MATSQEYLREIATRVDSIYRGALLEAADELDRLSLDAARYQWLRRDMTKAELRKVLNMLDDNCEEYLDAEIDAAMTPNAQVQPQTRRETNDDET